MDGDIDLIPTDVPADNLDVQPTEEPQPVPQDDIEISPTPSPEAPDETPDEPTEEPKEVQPEEPNDTEKEVKNKYDVNSDYGYFQKRKIKVHSDGNPVFVLKDEEYKALINRKFGSRWRTSNQKLRDWVKHSPSKKFWVQHSDDENRKYLYVAPRKKS